MINLTRNTASQDAEQPQENLSFIERLKAHHAAMKAAPPKERAIYQFKGLTFVCGVIPAVFQLLTGEPLFAIKYLFVVAATVGLFIGSSYLADKY